MKKILFVLLVSSFAACNSSGDAKKTNTDTIQPDTSSVVPPDTTAKKDTSTSMHTDTTAKK